MDKDSTQPTDDQVSAAISDAQAATLSTLDAEAPQQQGLPKLDVSSLYPTPVSPGVLGASPAPGPRSSRPAAMAAIKTIDTASDGGSQIIRPLLTVLGIVVLLSPILSIFVAYGLLMIMGGQTSYLGKTDVFSMIGSYFQSLAFNDAALMMGLVYLAVGVGILVRKEVARIALVTLMVISLIASIVNSVTYIQTMNSYNSALSSRGVATTSSLFSKSITSYYIANLVLSIIINIAVLLFLTRPTVRSEFS